MELLAEDFDLGLIGIPEDELDALLHDADDRAPIDDDTADTSPEQVCDQIVATYHAYYGPDEQGHSTTLSTIDTAKLPALAAAVKSYAALLTSRLKAADAISAAAGAA